MTQTDEKTNFEAKYLLRQLATALKKGDERRIQDVSDCLNARGLTQAVAETARRFERR